MSLPLTQAFFDILPFQRFDFYIQEGMDLDSVAPLQDSWLKNIKSMVPRHLRNRKATMASLVEEVKEEYLLCVKKEICMYLFRMTEL